MKRNLKLIEELSKTIAYLNNELENIKKVRNTQRSKREDSGMPRVSLVGYTNVGKSTLRNVLVDMYQNDKTLKKKKYYHKICYLLHLIQLLEQ